LIAGRLLVVLAGWTLFAFAHSYRWTVLPLMGGIGLLAFLQPPGLSPKGDRPARVLDLALVLSLIAIALQLAPLSAALRSRFSPAAVAYARAMHFETAADAARPLSIEPAATLLALTVAAAIVLLFWSLRQMFERGGIRATVRALAWIGLVLSPVAIVQHLMAVPVLDVAWGLSSRGLRPYGPFVNRNDFAGWLIMAIPLTLGYAVARVQSRQHATEPIDHDLALDTTSVSLGASICLMMAGLLLSMSRSGLIGGFLGVALFAWLSRQRMTATRGRWMLLGLGALIAIAATYANWGALATRLDASLSEGLAGRLSIWRQTLPVVRDFWPFGTGAGTYQAAMVLYQTMSRFYYISHADNEFLQVLAEGGLLLAVPVAVALVAGVWLVVKRLRDDRSAIFWLRAGAAGGILALVIQNMVEMTLRVPANAVLFAILAAIAVHEGAPQIASHHE
jgi:O-antigen ligase